MNIVGTVLDATCEKRGYHDASQIHGAKFPMIQDKCLVCRGTGHVDMSYHGSPDFETCLPCRGTGLVVREMTPEEKLLYLKRVLIDGE